MKGGLKLWLTLDPSGVELEKGFSRDVTKTGHWGTGNLEVYICDKDDFLKAKPLIERAYQGN